MRDTDIGKWISEETALEPFSESFPLITGRTIEVMEKSESPDFKIKIDDAPFGLEVTEIRDCDEENDYLSEVYRIAARKDKSYRSRKIFENYPIVLLCYSDCFPFFDARRALERAAFWSVFDALSFSEIWLMDLADEYYSARDPRRPADLFGLKPEHWRGYHRFDFGDRKPFG
jgi:hypothetical protein